MTLTRSRVKSKELCGLKVAAIVDWPGVLVNRFPVFHAVCGFWVRGDASMSVIRANLER